MEEINLPGQFTPSALMMAELKELEAVPALAFSDFPYRGKPDFRGFTDEDYANFSCGVFYSTANGLCRWRGGSARVESARTALLTRKYAITEDKSGSWYVLSFEAHNKIADV